MKYEPNKLHEYIRGSELRIVNDNFKIRLSPELAKIYDAGDYDSDIATHAGYIDDIKALGIKYPGNANPVFYMYVVPDENFVELLSFPFPDRKGGGRPIKCLDLDGFNYAYGRSHNCLYNKSAQKDISRRVNGIHELAHLVHSQFWSCNRVLSEGFAEVLPLYTMGLEEKFYEHREIIRGMTPEDIIPPQELLSMDRDGSFGRDVVPGKSCSLRLSYISSYLFVRGYVAAIARKFGLDRARATQKFLEIVRSSGASYQFLIFDLADAVGMSGEEVLNSKNLQLAAHSQIVAQN